MGATYPTISLSGFLLPSSSLLFLSNVRLKERKRKRKNSNGNPGATNLSSKRKSVGEAPGDIRILIRSELESRSRRFQPLGRLSRSHFLSKEECWTGVFPFFLRARENKGRR